MQQACKLVALTGNQSQGSQTVERSLQVSMHTTADKDSSPGRGWDDIGGMALGHSPGDTQHKLALCQGPGHLPSPPPPRSPPSLPPDSLNSLCSLVVAIYTV